MTALRTALVVVVPEAAPVVDDFRRRFDSSAVARRIPPHVTLLYPFVEPGDVDAALEALEELYAGTDPFDFELARIDRFPEHVWLAPEPRGQGEALPVRAWARAVSLLEEQPDGSWAERTSFDLGRRCR